MELSQLLDKLAAYVPMPVSQAIYQNPQPINGPSSRRFPAAVLFSDISGFTPLSELLSQAGPTGAEELTNLINQYFTQMIDIIQFYHGQVVKFSGDALTVIFPAEEISMSQAVRRAGECALMMQAEMDHFSEIKTSSGKASLSMKVGIGAGKILECSIGGVFDRWEYVVGGDPLAQVAMAERQAKPTQIILSAPAWKTVEEFFKGTPLPQNNGFVALEEAIVPMPPLEPIKLDWEQLNPEQMKIAEQALQCYVPGAIKARLNEQSEWLAEIRRMTILFVGIGGFDYSDDNANHHLQQFLQATQNLIYRFEGSLGKVAVDDKGTVLIVLFGAPPFFHEDDNTRAVACALGLQNIAQNQNLHMAIGITEGSIFAGPVGAPNRREYTVIGDEVNLAARLMQYGESRDIIISQRVKERIGKEFILENLGNISLKGKTHDRMAYRVKGEQNNRDEFITRYLLNEDTLIGREPQLQEILEVAEKVKTKKQLKLLLIEAELGLGKSRLASELIREWIIDGNVGYGSACISYGRQIPYQGWREILAAIFGLTPGLSTERQLARLKNGINKLEDPPDQPGYWRDRLPLLADVVGLDTPDNDFTRHISGELRRNNTFALIEAILRRQTERHSLLILLENIQWADELSLSLATHLAQRMIGYPLFLVLLYRPLDKAEAKILSEIKHLPYTCHISLEPLSTEESETLIETLLQEKEIPPEAKEIIIQRGQGNPFFLQEIINAVSDVLENQTSEEPPPKSQKSISEAKKSDHKKKSLLDELDVPHTVQDAILTRIDRLSETEKLTLKIASVIGTNFQRNLLTKVHPHKSEIEQQVLTPQLEKLEEAKLIRLEIPEPHYEYVFHNITTQEIIYEGLLMAQRRQIHETIGLTLEEMVPEEIEQIAFHYSRSDNWEKAIEYLSQAAKKAQREYANQAAIRYYSKILETRKNNAETGGMVTPDYWDTLLERAKLYNLIGEPEKEEEDLGTLGILAEALDDDKRRALAAKQWAYRYETNGDYDSSLELVERTIELGKKVEAEKVVGEGYNQRGRLLFRRGEYRVAQEYFQKSLIIAQKHNDQSTQANVLNSLGTVAHYQMDYEVARYFFQEAIELWKQMGNQLSQGHSLSNLGQVYYDMGQYATAKKCYDQSFSLHRTIGDPAGEALARHNLGQVQLTLGNYEVAKTLLEEALVVHQATGDREQEVRALYNLGLLYTYEKNYKTAEPFLTETLEVLKEELNDLWGLGVALTYYSWFLIETRQTQLAQQHLIEALEIRRETGQKAAEIENIAFMGQVALLEGKPIAKAYAKHVLSFIRRQGLQGIEHPSKIYYICYQILQASKEYEQSQAVLKEAHQYILQQAEQINDEKLRSAYLDNIRENRKIIQLVDQAIQVPVKQN